MADRLAVDYPLLHWLNTDARRITEPKAFVGALVEKLNLAGIEVARLVTGIPILHPQVFSYSARWDPGQGVSERTFRADSAQKRIKNFNAGRPDKPPIESGIALHIGDVMYGNIGGENRLDFTVIGPAVNLVARIEGLCGELAQPVLLSANFVSACGLAARPLGAFRLKGLDEPQLVYAPPLN